MSGLVVSLTPGADDGIRTRDPHLGKVPIGLQPVFSRLLTWGFVRSVVRPGTPLPLCRRAVYLGSRQTRQAPSTVRERRQYGRPCAQLSSIPSRRTVSAADLTNGWIKRLDNGDVEGLSRRHLVPLFAATKPGATSVAGSVGQTSKSCHGVRRARVVAACRGHSWSTLQWSLSEIVTLVGWACRRCVGRRVVKRRRVR